MATDTGIQRIANVATPKGGADIFRSISIVNTGVAVKSSPGQIFSIAAHNLNVGARYLKVYNKAAPTASDTPLMTIVLPVGSMPPITFPRGADFTVAIGLRVTAALADNDNTAPTTAETVLVITYK